MLNAILFDLDNTIILFDEGVFYQGYFREIEILFADVMPPDMFRKRLIGATRALLENNGEVTNAEYFKTAFARGYEELRDEFWRRFIFFYDTVYDTLDVDVTLPDGLHDTFKKIARTGLKLVLASNPIFPFHVQMKRLAWASLEQLPFALVTHLENMSFCKPRIEYYQDICRKIGESPDTCLMVGNDPVNDMVAAKAGLKTYLTEDSNDMGRITLSTDENSRKHKTGKIPEPDFRGPLSDLLTAVERLQKPAV